MVVPDPSTWLNIRGYYSDDLVDMLLWHLNRAHSDKPQCEQCPTNWPPNTSIWLRICWRGLVSYWRGISTVTWGWTVWTVPWRELSLSLSISLALSLSVSVSLFLSHFASLLLPLPVSQARRCRIFLSRDLPGSLKIFVALKLFSLILFLAITTTTRFTWSANGVWGSE